MLRKQRGWLSKCLILTTIPLILGGCEDDDRVVKYACFDAGPLVYTEHIRDFDYLRFLIFDLGIVRDTVTDTLIRFLKPGDEITRLELYQPSTDLTGRLGLAYTCWSSRGDSNFSSAYEIHRFVPAASPCEYGVRPEGFCLRLGRDAAPSSPRAYYLEYMRDGVPGTIGDISKDTLVLQLLKPSDPSPLDPLWDAEWKNIYGLGRSAIDYDKLEVTICKGTYEDAHYGTGIDNQNGIPYLEILGLDRADQFGTVGNPDGKIDNDPALLDLAEGLLIFPDRRPFDTDIGYDVNAPDSVLRDRVPAIYDSNDYYEQRSASTYYIEVQYGIRPLWFSLEHVNLIPESEEVMFNSHRLERGVDYTIDYDIGWIDFLREDVADPDADLTICYDYAP